MNKPEDRTIPAGTQIYLGAPAKPMEPVLSAQITKLVLGIPAIIEAHLPQCYAKGIFDPPSQILVAVIAPDVPRPPIAEEIGRSLTAIMPTGRALEFLLLTDASKELPAVRLARCRIR